MPGAPESAAQLWEYVEVSRRADRIDSAQFLADHLSDTVVMPGTMQASSPKGRSLPWVASDGIPVVVAATTDRRSGQPLTVGGLRTIRRGIALAQRWGLPVVTLVDTLGAQLSVEGEQSGIAGEISRLMLDLVAARTQTVALLLGAGTGERPWRCSPPIGSWPARTRGSRRSHRRGPRPSATAEPTIRRRSPGTSGSGHTRWPS